jgi:lipopolysaccharide/colanic/teichoic acid biosynthesis glycosyltransferase
MQSHQTNGVVSGWQYRLASLIGTGVITVLSVAIANHPMIQRLAMSVPVFSRLPVMSLSNGSLTIAIVTVLVIVLFALFPLYKPRPRRILDVVSETQRRVMLAALALATIGYFDYTYRLPRSTLVLTTIGLLVLLPSWNVLIRRQKRNGAERVIIVGDDLENISSVLDVTDLPIVGYVSLSSAHYDESSDDSPVPTYTDGGEMVASHPHINDIEYLGGISRLSNILVTHDADTVILAFTQTDREEFFGVLSTCYSHGVTAKVHRELGNSVLTRDAPQYGDLVDINLEPWDWQDRATKRLFDIVFAATGLLLLSPLVIVTALAIKLDSPGSVIYAQERTSTFGGTFTVYKFRSMVDDAEAETGATISDEDAGGVDSRVTRVGHVLRRTHLDELPQLWSIFTGHMSVVGPRPERPEIDREITADMIEWKQRWFVKPGLTGLAQINDVTGHDPDGKLRFDINYIRQQSFRFDFQIVIRQVYEVLKELVKNVNR